MRTDRTWRRGRGATKHREYAPVAVELYQQGYTLLETAKELAKRGVDVSDTWVMERLHEAGVEMRGYGRRSRRTLTYDGQEIVLMGRHSPEKVRAILESYEAGASPQELSGEYDAPVSTIEKWVTKAGICRDVAEAAALRRVKEGEISPVAAARMAERMYVDEEKSVNECAEALGVTSATILAYLRSRGVETRSQSEGELIRYHGSLENYRRRVREVCRMAEVEGLTRTEISERTGHCYRTIAQFLESDLNPYRDHPEDVEKALLDWTPEPAPLHVYQGQGIREKRIVNSRSEAA